MTKTTSREAHWARLGAAVRLQEIRAEADAIFAAFPELRHGRAASSPPATTEGSRPRRTMSEDARKRMSAGMRRYWAKRKAADSKAARAKA